ncbi:MAG: sigma-54-dependent transcriptional regulator [Lautropia sp.]
MLGAILIIEDETVFAQNLKTFLGRRGYEVRLAESAEEGLPLIDTFKPGAVLLDYNLPGMNGLEALKRIRIADPQVAVVMMTGYGSAEIAVTAMKSGAVDYLPKPVALGELGLLLERLVGQAQLEEAVDYYQRREAGTSGVEKIVGDSPAIRDLKRTIVTVLQAERSLAGGRSPVVLITGETGTGKELVARALHYDGPRRSRPFIELNCGALPANLVEAEVFGYERGAFTDARQRKAGLAETADRGTLFLDEIGETEPMLQVKLLKLLEEQVVRRLGGLREQKVDVRVISATNRPLEKMVQEGRFRADLYYRLKMIELRVPPLRERGNDVLLLARHFIADGAARYRKDVRLSAEAEKVLMRHRWPGNVRELRNVIEQVVLLAADRTVRPQDLPMVGGEASMPTAAGPGGLVGEDLNLERLERRAIELALERSGGNVTQAARLLGVSRDTLRYRLERLQLRSES